MIEQRLENYRNRNRCTLLGVGPMSVNCVDATIELANDYEVPIMLIASRRQIDSEEFGGGYVNNWTTEAFANYVIDRDKKGKVLLARDHGGPWQNTHEQNQELSLRRAMESAKTSYKADIDAGFQILHIDPSIDIHGKPNAEEILDRLFELYEFCWGYAQQVGKEIIFEIGTEEQSGSTNTQEELNYTLQTVKSFCKKNKLPSPFFVVIQTGTRVMETRNVGSFDTPIRVADEIPAEIQVPKMLEICHQHNLFMKEHNTDYLSDDALQWHPRLGIHAANVAPEFGVTETKALLEVLEENNLRNLADEFLRIAYDSGKWKKWMLPHTKATSRDCSIIAGHYIFSSQECRYLKEEATEALKKKNIILDDYLKKRVKDSIFRYLYHFRLVRNL
jgi:tagatose-1,6-bisphosphate aldolase non-catalytic subunit AgaZ/GatZ